MSTLILSALAKLLPSPSGHGASAHRQPAAQHQDDFPRLTPAHAAHLAAVHASDALFQYETATVPALPPTNNVFGRLPSIHILAARHGAGAVIVGALAAGMQNVTVQIPASALAHFLPTLHAVAAQKLAVVFQVTAPALELAAVLAARDTGVAIVFAADAQEAYDLTLASHAARSPVVLVVPHTVGDALTPTPVRVPPANLVAAALRDAAPAPTTSIVTAFDALAPVLGQKYRPAEFVGPAHAPAAVVAFGPVAAALHGALAASVSRPSAALLGVLHVRVFRPLSAPQLVAALPPSVRTVVTAHGTQEKGGQLFSDVVASFYLHRANAVPAFAKAPLADLTPTVVAEALVAALTPLAAPALQPLVAALGAFSRSPPATPLPASHESTGPTAPAAAATPTATLGTPAPLAPHQVAWRVLFPEAYAAPPLPPQPAAPSAPSHGQLFRVRLTKNQRLTPAKYDRNIFHLEMDTTGTGLTYEIGDALGVFGHNDAAEVDAFLQFYGLDATACVAVDGGPFSHATHPGQAEVLTVARLLEQRVDLFGKPPKKFYAALAPFASDGYERRRLQWLGSDDKEGFKLRQLEAVTFADVLREFPSAHPPLQQLLQLLPPIKPRHYSIASSMKLCPGSVHLLIVEVDWVTPSGRTRHGLCTRYLANLHPEAPGAGDIFLTVDIKPSIMRLPADPTRPVVMAGLGTGMAPFRAFLQERAALKAAGVAVGPMSLYFGARFQASEFLYGAELEAWAAEGLLTFLRPAFSRDSAKKVYIQDRILEDRERLCEHLHGLGGTFYLCGPTWPVADIRKALNSALVGSAGLTPDAADDTIELWKAEGRYILEVY